VWNVCTGPITDEPADAETQRALHKTIKKVGEDILSMRFNTAISAMMILVKHLGSLATVPRAALRDLALIVAPFAPHLAEEVWERLGASKGSIAHEPWPAYDPSLVKDDVVEIGVQVNGKVRGTIAIAVDASEAAALDAARGTPNVATHLAGKTVKKVVYVPGKILNVIVG
jgi:leucyl-tRNA synthetase